MKEIPTPDEIKCLGIKLTNIDFKFKPKYI